MKDGLGFAIFAAKTLLKNSWVDNNVLGACGVYDDLGAMNKLSDFSYLFICTDDGALRFFGMCFDAGMHEDEVCEVLTWAMMDHYDSLKGGAVNG